jgi:phage gp29-like protein
MKYLEKYGIPFIIGKLPRGVQDSESEDLLQKLAAMINDAVCVTPDDASIELLYAKEGAGKIPQHQMLIDFCDKSMSVAILGHGSSVDSTPGRLGGEYVAEQASQDIIDTDSAMVCDVFDQLISWFIEINYSDKGILTRRPVFSLRAEDDVKLALSERDKTLALMGVKFTRKYLMKTYNFIEGDLNLPDESKNDGITLSEKDDGTILPPMELMS